jgi:hypothetical protein
MIGGTSYGSMGGAMTNDVAGSRGFKPATSIPPVIISEIYCPTERVSIIIGTKGVIINEISKRSNTIISIDEDPDKSIATLGARLAGGSGSDPVVTKLPPKSPLRRIEIRGTVEGIEVAKYLINGVVTSGPSFLQSLASSLENSPRTYERTPSYENITRTRSSGSRNSSNRELDMTYVRGLNRVRNRVSIVVFSPPLVHR